MASQQFSGSDGGVKVGAANVADLDSWDITIDTNMLKTTAYKDQWQMQKPGVKTWNGKASGRWNLTDTAGQKAFHDACLGGVLTDITLVISETPAINYSGQVWVKGVSIKSAVDATVDVDFTLEGNGPLTVNVATS